MKNKSLIAVAAVFLIVLIAGGYLYYLYGKPRAEVSTIKTAYSLSGQELYNEFVSNETIASEKYVSQILEVRGVVTDVQRMDGTAMVLLAAGDALGGINCSIKNVNDSLPVEGQIIAIKGRCTGYLMDVLLVDALIVK